MQNYGICRVRLMLELDNKEWEQLSHAYGKAGNIPSLLRKLDTYPAADNYEAEPYFSLWSALCHQGDTYTASFAAIPHVLEVCKQDPARAHWSLPQLAVCIEISRQFGQGPNIPSNLSKAYFEAIAILPEVTLEMTKANPNDQIGPISDAANVLHLNDPEKAEALLG